MSQTASRIYLKVFEVTTTRSIFLTYVQSWRNFLKWIFLRNAMHKHLNTSSPLSDFVSLAEFLPIHCARKNLRTRFHSSSNKFLDDLWTAGSKKKKKKEIKQENVEALLSNFETVYVPVFQGKVALISCSAINLNFGIAGLRGNGENKRWNK